MGPVFFSTSKVSDIVTKLPKASDILKSYRIDFCCGGNRALSEAIEERKLNEEEVLAKLNQAYYDAEAYSQNVVKWDEVGYSELIDHIVNKHHAYLTEELPELSMYVTKIARVHGDSHPELLRVHQLYHDLKTELEQHLIKEENQSFPLIKKFDEERTAENLANASRVIDALESEHDDAGAILKELREITNDYLLPPGACRTYTLTFNRLEELESDLFEHIHLENNILFPRVLQETV
ncbi:iron-sulfur cluster repair di-iron protein [Anaerobacillus sp. MEB173]|uniref:iron-sulfur cluster repair di-iron protein n=1 Tax=Anaerobacillus sp. MEB173 TaxID=3383345 RepID=UPI003F902D6C